VSRYRCVDARKAEQFPVAAACEAAGVSTSAYYAWVASWARGPAAAEMAEQQVVAEIRAIHADSDGVYGSRRVTAELRPPGPAGEPQARGVPHARP
jgi:putative transposase